jgi:hypothetical protein
MIDEFSEGRTGWARFSDDRRMRYRLARSLDGRSLEIDASGVVTSHSAQACFVMLNPSTADAFDLDPTVRRCLGFALKLGADCCQVVNVFALRSTDPAELRKSAAGFRGDDNANNEQIAMAARAAATVIVAWGHHALLGGRGQLVREMLIQSGVNLWHLGLTKGGDPRHPLYLKSDTSPQLWT